jgi:MobA/VirD2-like, nuclease domain
VIGKVPDSPDKRGERAEGLIYYLYGPGRHEEHTDPHIVAGWRHPAELEPPLRGDGRRDFRRLFGLLNQPHAALGKWGCRRPVWHCVMRAAPRDKTLSDDEWAQIAGDVMNRTGLSPYGQEDDAVRWIAVRHGDDHIHIVAMLARQDGRRWRLDFEKLRVRDACLAAEERYGLERTAPGDSTAARRPSRAESEKAARRGLDEPPRITLRRLVATAAAGAIGEQEFFIRLDQAGVQVRKRFSVRNPGQLTGYAVALPGDTGKDGGPVWYGGGKLAADMTLPKLRCRWPGPGTAAAERFTAAERNAIWEHAAQAAAQGAAQIRGLAGADPAAAADAAWAASDTLHVAAAALGSRILRQAADAYDRAARAPYARIPASTPAGNSLRRAARLISAFAYLSGDPALTPVVLVTRLAALAEAVAGLRQAQQHAAQAASALHAAERLHAAAARAAPGPGEHARVQSAAALAGAAFPLRPRPLPAPSPAPGGRRPAPRGPTPSRRRGR